MNVRKEILLRDGPLFFSRMRRGKGWVISKIIRAREAMGGAGALYYHYFDS